MESAKFNQIIEFGYVYHHQSKFRMGIICKGNAPRLRRVNIKNRSIFMKLSVLVIILPHLIFLSLFICNSSLPRFFSVVHFHTLNCHLHKTHFIRVHHTYSSHFSRLVNSLTLSSSFFTFSKSFPNQIKCSILLVTFLLSTHRYKTHTIFFHSQLSLLPFLLETIYLKLSSRYAFTLFVRSSQFG